MCAALHAAVLIIWPVNCLICGDIKISTEQANKQKKKRLAQTSFASSTPSVHVG